MNILDFYALKGFFKADEALEFKVITDKKEELINGRINIFFLRDNIFEYILKDIRTDNEGAAIVKIGNHGLSMDGYFAQITLGNKETYKTAFDVQQSWTDFPRYGYVSCFAPDQKDTDVQIEKMAKYHVNGVQFYDWQYRHDNLLSETVTYLDPFKRKMSLNIVNSYIEECHERNMSAMPYLAIYAASVEFWEKHKDWGMYDENGKALMFEDFLGLVNPEYNSPWFKHLDSECDRVLKNTEFDGLHIDQYGEPKEAYDIDGNEIDIPKAFVDFINHQKAKEEGTVVFNAVGNWPINDLAKSNADFMYIEVWDFTPTFGDLSDICVNARLESGQKPLVVPIYIKKDDFTNVLLADAVINASGGTHLEIGDGEKLLSDPYFPKAEFLQREQLEILRKYWDFTVGCQKFIGPKAVWKQVIVKCDRDIMSISRENGKYTAVNIINCSKDDKWCQSIGEVTEHKDLLIAIVFDGKIKNVMYASPDRDDIMPYCVDYIAERGKVFVTLPSLKYWSVIVIEEE